MKQVGERYHEWVEVWVWKPVQDRLWTGPRILVEISSNAIANDTQKLEPCGTAKVST